MTDPEVSMDPTLADRPRSSDDPFGLIPGDAVDRYEIIDRIGAGGMGAVYRARDPTLARDIALKLVRADRLADGESQARLLREAQAMAQVSHPNVLPIYDVGTVGRDVFIAMELVSGQSLPQWMRAQHRSPAQIIDAFIDAGQGLVAVHAAGLIHRDFKPSNVLLDHRVLIMDFGLARATGSPTEEGRARSSGAAMPSIEQPLCGQLTQASTVLGTPAYMAPEQMLAEEKVDERCDQFAFCVALFETIYGRRPFADGSMMELCSAKLGQRWVDVEPGDRLTRRLVPIVHRGMAARPDDRWPSMSALVDALEGIRAPARGRRWWALGTGAAALGGLVAWLALRDHAAPCDAEDRLARIWDEGERRAVRDAWRRSQVPYWEAALAKVEPRLDRYADAWQDQHRAVCEANRGAEAEESILLDRRSHCLEDRRRHLGALVKTLRRSDQAVVETAAQSVAALPRIDGCEDVSSLAARVEPPATPQSVEAVTEHREQLAHAAALAEAGLLDEAQALADEVRAAAGALGYAPLQAEADIMSGRLWLYRSEPSRAAPPLSQGYFAARELGMDDVALDAALGLVEAAYTTNRFEDGMQWSRTAEALLAAVGDEPSRRARVLRETGALLSEMGQEQQAIEKLELALQLEREAYGETDPRVARTRFALGTTLRRQEGRLDDSVQVLREALVTAEAAYDPRHPTVAKYHNNLGNALVMAEQLDDALTHYEHAEAITRAAFGDDDPNRAGYLISRSQIHLRRDELERAEALTTEALSLWEATHGPDHPLVALAANNLGVVHEKRGDDAKAAPLYRRALRISEHAFGSSHPKVAVLHRNLGDVLLRLDRREDARAQFQRVLTIADEHEVGLDDVAMAQFGLARLGWDEDEDRAMARALAEQARATLAELGPPVAAETEAATQWLAEHPVGGPD